MIRPAYRIIGKEDTYYLLPVFFCVLIVSRVKALRGGISDSGTCLSPTEVKRRTHSREGKHIAKATASGTSISIAISLVFMELLFHTMHWGKSICY